MKLSEILVSEEIKDSEKVAKIAEVVAKARKAYGNDDKVITAPEVNTTEGVQDLAMLSDKSKVAIADSEIRRIKQFANEFTKVNEGVMFDKKVEELIALSAILVNITTTTESEYI